MKSDEWEQTEDYQRWRRANPEAARQYDLDKEKKRAMEQKLIADIRGYKKKQYASMAPEERRALLMQLKEVYQKRKK